MNLSILAYGLVFGGFLFGASLLFDRTLRALGRQTRWVWVAALSATSGLPLLFLFWRPNSALAPGGPSLPVDLLVGALAALPLGGAEDPGRMTLLGSALSVLWPSLTFTMLAAIAWTGLRLRRKARGFERITLAGEEVLLSPGLGPAVMGLFRPVIVLPRWTLEMEGPKLDLILLHEREHVASRDPLTLIVGLLCLCLSPWNPWVWWMNRRLILAVEGDCDQRVLARGIAARHYGDLLVEVAGGTRSPSLLMPALAEGGTSDLERRLRMIRNAVRNHRTGPVLLSGLGSIALLVLACETPVPPVVDETLEATQDAAQPTTSEAEFQEQWKNPVDVGENTITIRASEEGAPSPLIVVDGVIISDPDFMETLDKELIERVEVIKGKTAQAEYGERGANGVILIFTKR